MDNDFKRKVINFIAETSVTLFEASSEIRKENRSTLGAIWLESEFLALGNIAEQLGITSEVNQRYVEIIKEKRGQINDENHREKS